ncbi:hypothetical protein [Methylobacterium sp. 1973]|uniref:hypothetical protein n=1 Tax=Methylobacterium sp. 1973 TaxID=3156421 RepID=UPI003390E023
MTWLDQALAYVLPARCFAKIHAGRVDAAFNEASEARSRKVEAADATIHANAQLTERLEGEAASIRARTEEQAAKWSGRRPNDIRAIVENMLAGMDQSADHRAQRRD